MVPSIVIAAQCRGKEISIRYQRIRVYVPTAETWIYEDKVHRLIEDKYEGHKVAGFMPAAETDTGVLIGWVRHPHKGQGQKGPDFKYKPIPDLILEGDTLKEIT